MRLKLLGGNDGAGVLLVYPDTRNEYDEALETLGRPAVRPPRPPRPPPIRLAEG